MHREASSVSAGFCLLLGDETRKFIHRRTKFQSKETNIGFLRALLGVHPNWDETRMLER